MVCVFRDRDRILLLEAYDRVKDERFLIPVGGGVKFRERSSDAIIREVREELSEEIRSVRYLGMIENIFTFDGKLSRLSANAISESVP